jgi:hypothetical protein
MTFRVPFVMGGDIDILVSLEIHACGIVVPMGAVSPSVHMAIIAVSIRPGLLEIPAFQRPLDGAPIAVHTPQASLLRDVLVRWGRRGKTS